MLCYEVWGSPNFIHWLFAVFMCPFSNCLIGIFFNVVVHLLSLVRLIVTPWTVAYQASLCFTMSQSLLKLISIESLIPSIYLILCHPLLLPSVFPSIRVFSNESDLWARWPKFGASALTSVLPVNIQDWFPLGLTGFISLQSKELSRVFSNTKCKSINSLALSLFYCPALTSIHDYMDLCQWSNVSAF